MYHFLHFILMCALQYNVAHIFNFVNTQCIFSISIVKVWLSAPRLSHEP